MVPPHKAIEQPQLCLALQLKEESQPEHQRTPVVLKCLHEYRNVHMLARKS